MLVDRNIINELAGKLADAIPGDMHELRSDIEDNFRGLLQNGLDKLDLVTREEFEIQSRVLERTRQKLDHLEQELTELQATDLNTDKQKPNNG
jgi:BMFP domain-containing protein YqiC